MRISGVQISRLLRSHYQVQVTRAGSKIDVRVNGEIENVRVVADYLAEGLDKLLDNMPGRVDA